MARIAQRKVKTRDKDYEVSVANGKEKKTELMQE
jgi:hypothetical protein